jgi:hypothetical protein
MPMNSKTKMLVAFGVAVAADLLQVILMPLFFEGVFSPWEDLLDVAVAGIMTSLLGWHWVFLPTAAAKLAPVADMAPFWTLAIFYVAARQKKTGQVGNAPTELKHADAVVTK